MATETIFADLTIRDKETAEKFVKALEESAKDPKYEPTYNVGHLKDAEEIRRIFGGLK